MRIGLLTGGGDCPGLNAAIRAVVKHGIGEYGHSIIGFRNGWKGVVDGDVQPLTRGDIRGVLDTGGTLLGTARYHPHTAEGGLEADDPEGRIVYRAEGPFRQRYFDEIEDILTR